MSDKDAMSDDTAAEVLARSVITARLREPIPGALTKAEIADAAAILAALDRAGWALVKRADVAESLFERDVWNALDAAAPKEPGQ